MPPHAQQMTKKQQKRMFAHAGIVAAASAILEDLEKNGMLSRLLRQEDQRKADEHHAQEETGKPQGQTVAQKAGTIMQKLLDKEVQPMGAALLHHASMACSVFACMCQGHAAACFESASRMWHSCCVTARKVATAWVNNVWLRGCSTCRAGNLWLRVTVWEPEQRRC